MSRIVICWFSSDFAIFLFRNFIGFPFVRHIHCWARISWYWRIKKAFGLFIRSLPHLISMNFDIKYTKQRFERYFHDQILWIIRNVRDAWTIMCIVPGDNFPTRSSKCVNLCCDISEPATVYVFDIRAYNIAGGSTPGLQMEATTKCKATTQ